MQPDQQLELSASAAVAAIAGGELTATAYTTTLLDRAEQLTDRRAVITLNPAGALAAAGRVDDARRSGAALGRLAGLPVIVKDNINTKDLPTTAGTPALREFRPTADAPVLRPLLDAGAIVLGKANMHELAFGITNTNFAPFAGTAANPYDPSRIPGGSSGGTAVAIATRIAPAGLGSDTGASVRIPAAYNGIAGLRPSTGGRARRYSGTGVCPLSHTLDTVGPMARTVADVALLDSVITGAPIPRPARLDGLRVGIPAALWSGLEGDVDTAVHAAKQRLADAGVVFVDADMPDVLTFSEKIIFPVALHEPMADIAEYLDDSGATGITVESIVEQIASPDVKKTFEVVLADAMAAAYPDAVDLHRPELQRRYSAYFADHSLDALLFPTSPILPAPIDPVNGSGTVSVDGGPPMDTFLTTIRNMGPGSCAGVPSLSLPAGMSAGGLPVGLNLEGPIDGDSTILAIGMAVESLLGPLPAPRL